MFSLRENISHFSHFVLLHLPSCCHFQSRPRDRLRLVQYHFCFRVQVHWDWKYWENYSLLQVFFELSQKFVTLQKVNALFTTAIGTQTRLKIFTCFVLFAVIS